MMTVFWYYRPDEIDSVLAQSASFQKASFTLIILLLIIITITIILIMISILLYCKQICSVPAYGRPGTITCM